MNRPALALRKGLPDPELDKVVFRRRFLSRYADPVFEFVQAELASAADAAWDAYSHYRKPLRARARFREPGGPRKLSA